MSSTVCVLAIRSQNEWLKSRRQFLGLWYPPTTKKSKKVSQYENVYWLDSGVDWTKHPFKVRRNSAEDIVASVTPFNLLGIKKIKNISMAGEGLVRTSWIAFNSEQDPVRYVLKELLSIFQAFICLPIIFNKFIITKMNGPSRMVQNGVYKKIAEIALSSRVVLESLFLSLKMFIRIFS